MSKNISNLPSQGAAFRAAIKRQQRDLQNMNRVLVTNSVARDLARMQRTVANSLFQNIARDLARPPRITAANSLFRDIAREIARPPRIIVANSLFRDIRRISPTLFETNVANDYRRIAEALQAQQQHALRAQRLLLRTPIREALEHIKRTTELFQRQCKSIARAAVGSAFAKDMRGIAESAGNAPASRQSDKRKAPTPVGKDAGTTLGTPYAVGLVSKEATVEWKITVFLAKLPAYLEPPEDPPPKYRMH